MCDKDKIIYAYLYSLIASIIYTNESTKLSKLDNQEDISMSQPQVLNESINLYESINYWKSQPQVWKSWTISSLMSQSQVLNESINLYESINYWKSQHQVWKSWTISFLMSRS